MRPTARPRELAAETRCTRKLTFSFDDATNKVSVAAADLPGGYEAADDALVAAPFADEGAGNNFYFVMTDRFDNGSTANDSCIATGHAGADGVLPVDCDGTDRLVTGFDPTDKGFFNGGDIQGLHDRLDYIEGLGTTAIWLTPSFVNRPVQGAGTEASAGYHGYWVTDFTRIDPHLGTNAELGDLIDAAHERGIKVYFDIIANHTADVIYYAGHEGTNPPYVTKATSPYVDVDGNPFDPPTTRRATGPCRC
ncbi:alpha-amylase family glycosyl hydrolase [Tessaracoccus coleopterorum]|uniref:alpha-amylase family glycosyl hydrolase n=1 Tax=Tessaracoccus coleopterorum TaxID=2714950 RepID=UPI0018D38CD0|nr:alpha-amylase family glycosyl hydrolase [Tessaracoccus coleopterorum]